MFVVGSVDESPLICNFDNGFTLLIPTLPLLLTNKNVDDPLVTAKDPDPKLTDAVIEPVAICEVLNPAIEAT